MPKAALKRPQKVRVVTKAVLRREIKKAIDRLPDSRLQSIADYLMHLSRPPLKERIEKAEREFKAGIWVDWRKVRDDV